MSRILTLLAIAGLCTSLSAQSFPHLDIDKVRRSVNASGNGSGTVKTPDDTEPEVIKPEDIDGDTVLAHYKSLLDGYMKDKKGQIDKFEVYSKDVVDSLKDYIEGKTLLRLGFYDEAEDKFKGVGYEVKDFEKMTEQQQKDVANEIRSGKAYYHWVVAVVMKHYKTFEDDDELNAAWKKADKEASKVIGKLKRAIKSKKIEAVLGDRLVIDIQNWLLNQKNNWRALWNAERSCNKYPGNISSWQSLVAVTGTTGKSRLREVTPAFLKQRAALEVIKKFWVTDSWVMGGSADAALAYNYYWCNFFPDALSSVIEKSYHTRAGKKRLRFAHGLVVAHRRKMEKLHE
ncbi:MAG: hypothetical protein ACYTDT_09010 [Planctomycetota bacterium]|jgi:hypothetical protein